MTPPQALPDDYNRLRALAFALLHQIDINDFQDSLGHSASMLTATLDLRHELVASPYRCLCGVKSASECGPDDAWEPTCDLGNNAQFATAAVSAWPHFSGRSGKTFHERKAERKAKRGRPQSVLCGGDRGRPGGDDTATIVARHEDGVVTVENIKVIRHPVDADAALEATARRLYETWALSKWPPRPRPPTWCELKQVIRDAWLHDARAEGNQP